VKDSGVGIPADRLPDLWEGFTQMADPLRRGVEGLGLGLALVKYIVRAHGGRVWANSEEGVGSTFGFEIPLEGPQGPGQSFQASGSSVEGDAV
jgi:signal transduction histidine kinase